jgi:pyruvate-formate lyase
VEAVANRTGLTYRERIDQLRRTKMSQTAEKQKIIGAMDYDDWALVLPPPALRRVTKIMGASGVEITDVLLQGYAPEPNHPSGGFFGPEAVGRNFRRLLEMHPTYLDPMSSLAGAYMTNFFSYRSPHWNPDLGFDFLAPQHALYKIAHGIGGVQHFCHDFVIGLELGWSGLLSKVRRFRAQNSGAADGFYQGLEDVVLGMQSWIGRTAEDALGMAEAETDPERRENLRETARINARLVNRPPETFREACQWMLWYLMAARMFDGSGALGRLDLLLLPYYERDVAAGRLDDEEAIFHIACMLLRDTSYLQVGGIDTNGRDDTNRVSFLVLEAANRLRIPANVGVAVGERVDPELLRRSALMMLANKNGVPKFLGVDQTAQGFARNGYPLSLGYQRVYSGCHWNAIPGREYTLNDIVKINLGVVFDVALREMVSQSVAPGMGELWTRFEAHLRRAVDAVALGIDFHMKHMQHVFPELVLDLLCYGPVEKGLDAAGGGVEFYDLGVDAAALGTVADSFAALQLRVETERRFTWKQIIGFLDADWAGAEGQKAGLVMKNSPRYGSGGSIADEAARRISQLFTGIVKEKRTPDGFLLLPGLFSWALVIGMGKELGATPNGRHAGDVISQGANPNHGFRTDAAATALAEAIALVQPGFGNTAPMQIDIDPGLARESDGAAIVESLVRTHFTLGGTQINMNVVDAKKVLEAHKDPGKYPDLVVRVTGFSAYFASLSPELRQFVVDRMLREGA